MKRVILLYFCLVACALWLGGFAFYFGVVVPIGGKIVGGSEQGLVTQQVTNWLNVIGSVSLLILLCNAIPSKDRLLMGTWALLVICQGALFAMHWRLDRLIDTTAGTVTDPKRFHTLHELYETAATVQWLVGMVHWAGILRVAWQAKTREAAQNPGQPE